MISTSPKLIRPETSSTQGQATRFGNTALKQGGEVALEEIRNLALANRIYNSAGKKLSGLNAQVGGLSLEDLAGRFLTIFGVYLPQAYYSLKEKKHIIETNARNILVWSMTFAIYIVMKNDKVGLNTVFDQFMKEKADPEKLKVLISKASHTEAKEQLKQQLAKAENPGFIGKLVNKMRLDHNYFDLLQEAGIKFSDADRQKMFWTKLDKNHTDKLAYLVDDIAEKLNKELKKPIHNMDLAKYEHLVKSNALKEASAELQALLPEFTKMKTIRKFLMRRGNFSLLNTAAITGTLIYLVGGVAMKIVLNTVAPLDHDFVPAKNQNLNNPIYKWIMKQRAAKKGLEAPQDQRQIKIPETFNSPYPEQGYPSPPIKAPVNQLVRKMTPHQQLQFQQALLKFQAIKEQAHLREGQS